MKRAALLLLATIAAAGAIEVLCRRSPSAVTDSSRSEQTTEEGTPVIQEWGEESFPASDPPQSW